MSASRFACTYEGCTRTFDREAKLKLHMYTHTGERPFVCPQYGCGRAYNRPDHLRRHIASVHMQLKAHKCTHCTRSFAEKSHLKAHMAIHGEERRYHCTWPGCGASYKKHNQLRRHMCNHTGEMPYPCKVEGCTAAYRYPSHLRVHHDRVHSGIKRYHCTFENCNEAFVKFSELVAHKKAANHLPTYTCEECQRVFKTKRGLKMHSRVHSTLPQVFTCEECSATFTSSSSFAEHLRTSHHGVTHTCDHCQKQFKAKHILVRHLRTHHQNQTSAKTLDIPAERDQNDDTQAAATPCQDDVLSQPPESPSVSKASSRSSMKRCRSSMDANIEGSTPSAKKAKLISCIVKNREESLFDVPTKVILSTSAAPTTLTEQNSIIRHHLVSQRTS